MAHYLDFRGGHVLFSADFSDHEHVVFEGELDTSEVPATVRIAAPEDYRQKWPSLSPMGGDVREVPGPVRRISCEEWAQITGREPETHGAG